MKTLFWLLMAVTMAFTLLLLATDAIYTQYIDTQFNKQSRTVYQLVIATDNNRGASHSYRADY